MSTEKITPKKPISSADVPWAVWNQVPRAAIRFRHLTSAVIGEDYHVGLAIEELAPGKRTSPAHYHIFEEEHLYLLEGSLSARIGLASHDMKAGDYVCFPAGQVAGHTLTNNGDAVCRYVIVGEKNPKEVAVYTDSNKVLVRALGRRAIFDMAARRGYWDGEETGLREGVEPPREVSPPPETERNPKTPISLENVPWEPWSEGARFGGRVKHLTMSLMGRDYRVGMVIEEVAPGKQSCPFHYHLLEEEQVLVLEGSAALRLGEEIYQMKLWDYVCFPAGQRAGHCFINNSTQPFRYLIIGERNPHDVCVYPDSNKILVRALDLEHDMFDMGATRNYWDGEGSV